MSDKERPINWEKTTFDGSRREQLRRAQTMTVRQRLEAMNELIRTSECMQIMRKQPDGGADAMQVAPGVRPSRGRPAS